MIGGLLARDGDVDVETTAYPRRRPSVGFTVVNNRDQRAHMIDVKCFEVIFEFHAYFNTIFD